MAIITNTNLIASATLYKNGKEWGTEYWVKYLYSMFLLEVGGIFCKISRLLLMVPRFVRHQVSSGVHALIN